MKKFTLAICLLAMFVFLGFTGTGLAQSTTAGDVRGNVLDSTGAAIPGAKVEVKNLGTGAVKTDTTGGSGGYHVALLSPGSYQITVMAPGFSTSSGTVMIAAGEVTSDDVRLSIGKTGTVVEVTGEPIMVNTENGDVSTAFTAEQVQALPNPGNDLTFVAQTAPGSVMNTGTTAGGYGNFSSFGISGLSNMFTLDGGYENDPFLNLNNTGASNLTLGNNEVDTVTVISPAYSSQFGGLGGAQVNEITQAGGNRIHGNASYYWDGRVLNSNDFFNKQSEATNGTQNIPTFVNANQWGASIGGPIVKDKLFWFVNTEGIRAVTPNQGTVFAPSTAAQLCANGGDPGGARTIPGYGTVTYSNCANLNAAEDTTCVNGTNQTYVGNLCDGDVIVPPAAGQLAQMQRIFSTFNNSPYRPKAATSITQSPLGDPATVSYFATSKEVLTEWLLTARVDYKIGDKDNFFIHYKQDHGIQPTYTDLISPLFTDQSVQPAWEGQISETHNFTPNLVNQLLITGNYYSAPFENTNPTAAVSAAAPSTVEFENGGLASSSDFYGGINYAFPQGRNVAGYQIIDDVSWTRGRNTVRFGYNIRRDNITDIQGEETTYPVSITYEEDFLSGITDVEYLERFPQRPTQPVSVYNEGGYVEDAFKVLPNLTITAGLRIETNSNPTCHTNCFSVLANATGVEVAGSAPTTVPYNAAFTGGLISGNRHQAFKGYQAYAPMPRISFNWAPTPKTTIRGGFGMFTDTFPGLIADDLLSNAPGNYHSAVYAPYSGAGSFFLGYDTTAPQVNDPYFGTVLNAKTTATQSAAAFQTGYYATTGNTEAAVAAAVAAQGGHFSTPSITTVAPQVQYPTYEEFSLAVEQRIDNKSTISATYVGNHGYHEPVANGGNNLTVGGSSATYFPNVPISKAYASFATVTNIYSGAVSNFNGVVLSATRRSKALTLQFNYEFSKAIDEVSNGGLEPFAPDAGDSASLVNPYNLAANYALADYNVKHNVTGSFVYELPSFVKSSNMMRNLTGGFEFSGDVFHQSGLPYSVTQSTTSYNTPGTSGPGLTYGKTFANGGVLLLAHQTTNNFDHHCGGGSHVVNVVTGANPTPCNFAATGVFVAPTALGQSSRNELIGPSYSNVNFGAFKTVVIPHYEFMKLKLGAQFFNLFNHTNFQNPGHGRSSSVAEFGGISSTVGAPTSILGSVGGADASPRLIQLHAALTF